MPATALVSRAAWLAPVMLLLGSVFFTLIWILLALFLGRSCGWMALLGAVDAFLILHFSGMRPGWRRACWAVLATLGMIVVANWGIAATQIGISLGLSPWDSATKLGLYHAWTLVGLANQTADRLWMATALVLALLLGRGRG